MRGRNIDPELIYRIPLLGLCCCGDKPIPDNRLNISISILLLPDDLYEANMRNAGALEIDDVSCDPRNRPGTGRASRLSYIEEVDSESAALRAHGFLLITICVL